MNLRTFSAATMAQALVQVKHELGSEAVILHTRCFQKRRWMGLRRQEVVEITAGTGVNLAARSARRPSSLPAKSSRAPAPIGYAASPADARRQLLQSPAANAAMMLGLNQEVGELKKMIGDLVTAAKKGQCPDVPDELVEFYTHLVENQVAEELAADVLRTIKLGMRPEQLKQIQYVQEKLLQQIEKMLPASGPITRTKTQGPHVVALIGPTGVGKTTTLAKLAAHLKINQRQSVGLITLDTYRIAAVDQLRKYAEIIGSPLRVVSSPEDLQAAVASMNDCQFVLIDTAGRSPSDTLKLQELRAFLNAVNPDEVHLVLASTASQACIEFALARFGAVRIDRIIFTKLDEAVHVGVVLNVVHKVNKALSYVTTGQDVPADIEVVRGRRLAEMILSGPEAGRQA